MRRDSEGEESVDPAIFLAETTKVYVVPGVSPVRVRGEVDPVFVLFPGVEVTV